MAPDEIKLLCSLHEVVISDEVMVRGVTFCIIDSSKEFELVDCAFLESIPHTQATI